MHYWKFLQYLLLIGVSVSMSLLISIFFSNLSDLKVLVLVKLITIVNYLSCCSYPMVPPSVRFITRIFHPNVSRHGDVGIDCIQHNWTLALTISKVLISIQSLLTDPFCQVNFYRFINIIKRALCNDCNIRGYDFSTSEWERKCNWTCVHSTKVNRA